MKNKFAQHIQANFPEFATNKILVAVSGGLDSVVLLHLLHQLKFDVIIAHCNFNLREKDADIDEDFVRNLGEKLNIPTLVKSFNTNEFTKKNKLSIQEAARKLRYDWFNELIVNNQADLLVTAHHLNDNFETVLHHLTRGTGLTGLLGIPSKNKNTYRPLLAFTRKEIKQFANENNITWREDKSNAQTKYIRNKIRHKVLPVLQEINPNLLHSFSKTLAHLTEANAVLQEQIVQKWQEVSSVKNKIIQVDIQKLKQLSNVDFYLYNFFKPFGFNDVSEIKKLLYTQSGKQLFSAKYRLLKDRKFLLLDTISIKKEEHFSLTEENEQLITDFFRLKIEINPENTEIYSDKEKKSILIDKDLLKFPLTVRKWQKGDYFYPSKMQGKKKLSKFFKDNKLNLFEKEKVWVLLSDTKIVWVIGIRQDKRFSVTKTTKNKVKISFERR